MARLIRMVCCFLLLVTAGESLAQERFILGGALGYRNEKAQADDAKGEVTTMVYNLTIGADLSKGLMVGMKYFRFEDAYGSDDSDADLTITGLGATLGYFHKSGFMIMGSYLFDTAKELPNSEPLIKYSGKTGSVIDIGYLFNMKSWAVGPQFSIASTEYETVDVDGDSQDLNGTWKDESTYPSVGFYAFF